MQQNVAANYSYISSNTIIKSITVDGEVNEKLCEFMMNHNPYPENPIGHQPKAMALKQEASRGFS